ncbi:MAG TPA: TldD/PmbA family protein [Flavisolibacter sp.]|nr:TldD/PmbA family protein [Flavisolibacter sp.]
MPLLTEKEAKAIIDKVLSYAKADETSISLTGGRTGNIRYARNTVTTSGERDNLSLTVTTVFGKRSGSATVNEFTDTALEQAVRKAEEIARLAPENAEYMPLLGPQTFLTSQTFSANTAAITPQFRAVAAYDSIAPALAQKLVAAGYLEDNTGFNAIGNSKGLFGYNSETGIDFSITIRTADGKGSGFAQQTVTDAARLDAKTATAKAVKKAVAAAKAIEMPPGQYTVILEPIAAESFLGFFSSALDARSAAEGRSYLSKKGGGTRLGEAMFDPQLTIYSDPYHAEAPSAPFSNDGRPLEKVTWVKDGAVQNLSYSRFWAEKQGVKAVPPPQGLIIEGGKQSLEELIRGTDKGLLVTRTWYMRMVDPQSMVVTGLTRDGVFYIENGVIKHAVKNFRFNESPLNMFRNLEAMGQPVRVGNNLVPPMKIRNFNFTSLSDAV